MRPNGPILSTLALLAAGPVLAQEACPGRFPVDADRLTCACDTGVPAGAVWGSGPYTADSAICVAAIHAGAVDPTTGGTVTAVLVPGADAHPGSTRNGVTTRDWGSYDPSFAFEAPAAEAAAPPCGAFEAEAGSLTCSCAPGEVSGSVWGSDPYTSDSAVCAAAIHAGVIDAETGGQVTALAAEGLEAYPASTANGVETMDWGAWDRSFTFAGAAIPAGMETCGPYPLSAPEYACACPAGAAGGAVWGSGPYTADSDICAAARHAGVIGAGGGPVTVMAFPGLDGYLASERNGVATMDWGSDPISFVFDANRQY